MIKKRESPFSASGGGGGGRGAHAHHTCPLRERDGGKECERQTPEVVDPKKRAPAGMALIAHDKGKEMATLKKQPIRHDTLSRVNKKRREIDPRPHFSVRCLW